MSTLKSLQWIARIYLEEMYEVGTQKIITGEKYIEAILWPSIQKFRMILFQSNFSEENGG